MYHCLLDLEEEIKTELLPLIFVDCFILDIMETDILTHPNKTKKKKTRILARQKYTISSYTYRENRQCE